MLKEKEGRLWVCAAMQFFVKDVFFDVMYIQFHSRAPFVNKLLVKAKFYL